MVRVSPMLPVPVALSPLAPPVAVAVQVSEAMSGLSPRASVTDAPVAVEGPAFEAVMVYVIEVPVTAVPGVEVTDDPPSVSVFVIDRVAWAFRLSVSVAATVEASVAAAVAVLERVPVTADLIEATTL